MSKRESTVAVSTTEAEYIAAAQATKEALWLRLLLNDLGVPINTFQIMADNQSALKLLKNPVISSRSKHIDVVFCKGARGERRRGLQLHQYGRDAGGHVHQASAGKQAAAVLRRHWSRELRMTSLHGSVEGYAHISDSLIIDAADICLAVRLAAATAAA